MRALKIVGKVVAWLVLLVYFIYLRFPYERVRPRLEEQLAQLGSYEVSFDHVGPDGLGGIRLSEVEVRSIPVRGRAGSATPTEPYRLDRLDARPRLLSLVRGKAGAHLHAEGYGGSVSGTVSQASDTEIRIDLDIDHVDMTEIPMPNEGGIQGVLDGRIDDLVVVPGQALQGLNGRIEFEATDGAVLPFRTRTTRIPPQPVRFTTLSASAEVEAGQARIEGLKLTGPDVSASGQAEITLSRNMGRSPITGEIKVKFEENFSVYEDVVKGLTRARTDSEGFLTLPLKGTLSRPM